jgi:hypothetical protein
MSADDSFALRAANLEFRFTGKILEAWEVMYTQRRCHIAAISLTSGKVVFSITYMTIYNSAVTWNRWQMHPADGMQDPLEISALAGRGRKTYP